MNNTIKSICRGNAFSTDNCGMKNEKIKNLVALQIKEEEKLSNTLTKEQKSLFERIEEISLDIENCINEEYFEKGFQIGMKIAIEVLTEK